LFFFPNKKKKFFFIVDAVVFGVKIGGGGGKHECMIGGSDAKESVEHQSYLGKTKTRHVPS
jgi:hypothetical protein